MPVTKTEIIFLELCKILQAMDESLGERDLSGRDTLSELGIGNDCIGQAELLDLQDRIWKQFNVRIGPKGNTASLQEVRSLTLGQITNEIHRLLKDKMRKERK